MKEKFHKLIFLLTKKRSLVLLIQVNISPFMNIFIKAFTFRNKASFDAHLNLLQLKGGRDPWTRQKVFLNRFLTSHLQLS